MLQIWNQILGSRQKQLLSAVDASTRSISNPTATHNSFLPNHAKAGRWPISRPITATERSIASARRTPRRWRRHRCRSIPTPSTAHGGRSSLSSPHIPLLQLQTPRDIQLLFTPLGAPWRPQPPATATDRLRHHVPCAAYDDLGQGLPRLLPVRASLYVQMQDADGRRATRLPEHGRKDEAGIIHIVLIVQVLVVIHSYLCFVNG